MESVAEGSIHRFPTPWMELSVCLSVSVQEEEEEKKKVKNRLRRNGDTLCWSNKETKFPSVDNATVPSMTFTPTSNVASNRTPTTSLTPPKNLRLPPPYLLRCTAIRSRRSKIPMASAPTSTNGNGSGSGLPTHAATSKPPMAADDQQRRRRLCVCLVVTLGVLLVLGVTLLVLFLTVLRVRDPTTRLVSARLIGVAPRLTFPAISLQLNVTLLLTVAVHNPNPASFAYPSGGHTDLTYRGAHVGDAEIDPGRIPSKGDGTVQLALTVQVDRLAGDVAQLIADVEAGSVPLDASTRIPGRVAIFGVFKRHAVAYSDCHFVFGVTQMRIRSQECNDRTKL